MSRRQRQKPAPQPKPRRKVYVSIFSVVVIIILLYFVWPRPGPAPIPFVGGVTIVDSFYSTTPSFTDEAVGYVRSQGLKVSVYKDKNITVRFYEKLPSYSNSILLLRLHSGTRNVTGTPTYLFTTQLYNQFDYFWQQLDQSIMAGKTSPNDPNEKPVFTVGPQFITMLEGQFNDTIVILSSCYGLTTADLATEFINKGVKAFISWDDKVSLFHTDRASTLLLKLLVENKMTVSEAVATVMNNIGADPDYKSALRYFPAQAGAARARL